MKQSTNFDLDVLVHGSESRKYFHDGKFYVEGKRGSNFTIKLRNNTSKRVLAVLTVDGLSAIDGKDGSFDGNGYILDAWSSIKVPGWRLNNSEVASFEFTDGEESYAGRKGKIRNIGVIGCAFYYEKERNVWPTYIMCDHGKHCGCPRNDLGLWWNGTTTTTTASSYPSGGSTVTMKNFNVGDSIPTAMSMSAQASSNNSYYSSSAPAKQSLGTGFGDKATHRVTTSSFERANEIPNEILTVYYDTRQGLQNRGINLDYTPEIASPFPKDNYTPPFCEPPKGWRG